MDKIECFVAGVKIASGVLKDSRIETCGDDFECPSDMFQTHLNNISPPGEFQLRRIRAMRPMKY